MISTPQMFGSTETLEHIVRYKRHKYKQEPIRFSIYVMSIVA